MSERLGDGPLQAAYRAQMEGIARAIDGILNGDAQGDARKNGFVLLVFPFGAGDDHRCNFISNGAKREDIVVLFKEMIARFEGQPEIRGKA